MISDNLILLIVIGFWNTLELSTSLLIALGFSSFIQAPRSLISGLHQVTTVRKKAIRFANRTSSCYILDSNDLRTGHLTSSLLIVLGFENPLVGTNFCFD